MSQHEWYVWLAAFLVGTLSVARTARLITFDDFPPVAALRFKFFVKMGDSPWKKLAECAFCLSPYLAAGMVAWAWLSDLAWWWWVPNVWWAMSYLAAIAFSYDQPPDGND